MGSVLKRIVGGLFAALLGFVGIFRHQRHLNPEEVDIEQVRNQTRRDVRDHADPYRGTPWR